METCKICNKNFTSLSAISKHIKQKHKIKYYNYLINICNISHPICPICNKNKVIFKKGKFTKYCSFECSVIGNSQNIEVNTRRSNSLKKFNKEHPEVRKKVNEGLKELYSKNNIIKEKVSAGLIKYWNTISEDDKNNRLRGIVNNNKSIIKRTKTLKELYKDNNELKNIISINVKKAYADNPNLKYITSNAAREHRNGTSIELLLLKKLQIIDPSIIHLYKYKHYEFDFYSPKFNILIEADGSFWHIGATSTSQLVYYANLKFTINDYKKMKIKDIPIYRIGSDKIELINTIDDVYNLSYENNIDKTRIINILKVKNKYYNNLTEKYKNNFNKLLYKISDIYNSKIEFID